MTIVGIGEIKGKGISQWLINFHNTNEILPWASLPALVTFPQMSQSHQLQPCFNPLMNCLPVFLDVVGLTLEQRWYIVLCQMDYSHLACVDTRHPGIVDLWSGLLQPLQILYHINCHWWYCPNKPSNCGITHFAMWLGIKHCCNKTCITCCMATWLKITRHISMWVMRAMAWLIWIVNLWRGWQGNSLLLIKLSNGFHFGESIWNCGQAWNTVKIQLKPRNISLLEHILNNRCDKWTEACNFLEGCFS